MAVYTDSNGRRYVADDSLPPGPVHRATRVEARSGLRIWVKFNDGAQGEVDLSDLAEDSRRVRELWSDPDYLETVHVPDYGGVAWAGELMDVSPTVLYMRVTGEGLDEACPQVRFLD